MPLRYISLFSGGFGLDLGMEAAGFNVAACVEWASAMRETIHYNRPRTTIIGAKRDEHGGDLYKITTDLILQRAKLKVGEADLVVGGPPCQSFSILGDRQGLADPRGSLMLEYVRVVREAQPRCFIMENVSGLLTLHKGAALAQIKDLLRNAKLPGFNEGGYPVIRTWVLNAVDFGVPQYRERVFLVGFRSDVRGVEHIQSPPKSHRPPHDKILKNLFDLAEIANAPEDERPQYLCVEDVLHHMPPDLPNHELRVHGERVRTRYSQVVPGTRDRVDHTDRLRWNRPSGTVLVGSSDGGGRPFIHPGEPRHLTVREAARLQAFPDTWIFCGTQTDQYRQVGNAVPPPLGAAVARCVIPYLLGLSNGVKSASDLASTEEVHDLADARAA